MAIRQFPREDLGGPPVDEVTVAVSTTRGTAALYIRQYYTSIFQHIIANIRALHLLKGSRSLTIQDVSHCSLELRSTLHYA